MRNIVAAHYNLLPYHLARYNAFTKAAEGEYRLTSLLLRATPEYNLFDRLESNNDQVNIVRLDDDFWRGPPK